MSKVFSGDENRARQLLAQEAARIIVDQGLRDYGLAKKKAAERLGLNNRRALPGNQEIEQAISEHLQLFNGAAHGQLLRRLREVAASVMAMLQPFEPRLVGPVLVGTADDNSAINLHLFADGSEQVALFLADQNIACRLYERRLKARRGRNVRADVYPGYEFRWQHEPVEATVFPIDGIRQAPISPINGRPMQRADRKEVVALLDQDSPDTKVVPDENP